MFRSVVSIAGSRRRIAITAATAPLSSSSLSNSFLRLGACASPITHVLPRSVAVGSSTVQQFRYQAAAAVEQSGNPDELVAQIERLKAAYMSSRKQLMLKEGRDLLETASLALDADFDVPSALKVIDAANVFRPDMTKPCEIIDQASARLLHPEVVDTLPMAQFAKVAHTLCILRTPMVFDVLVAFIPTVIKHASNLDVRSLALISNAYGRTGTRHTALYNALTARTKLVARDCTVMAQIANMIYAFALAGCKDPEVFQALGDAALQLKDQAVPLVVATIFEGFATSGQTHDALFEELEKKATEKISECSPPLLSSLLVALAKLKRKESIQLIDAAAKRAATVAPQFDPTSIAKCLRAFQLLEVENEDFFGAMAERSCTVWGEFSAKDVAMTTSALAHFELYDAELFPLLARRTLYLIQKRYAVNIIDLASILGSFAAVHDRNDDLIAGASRLLYQKHELLTGPAMITVLWAFATLNVKNDLTTLMVAGRKRISPAHIEADNQRWEVATKAWPELLTEPKPVERSPVNKAHSRWKKPEEVTTPPSEESN